MKKCIVAILAFLYITASAGAAVKVHYCMGELTDWDIWQKDSKTCNNCGMEKSNERDNGCCKDEHKFVKNNIDQKTVAYSFQLMELMGSSPHPVYAELPFLQILSITEKNPVSNAPPRSNSIAVYILNRTFLI